MMDAFKNDNKNDTLKNNSVQIDNIDIPGDESDDSSLNSDEKLI